MKKQSNTPPSNGLKRRDALLLTALASAMALAGCGGGGGGDNVAGVSSGGTGSFSTGAISGFGSIIVAGVRFDDSKASTVRNDDDNTDLRGQLKLGMVVRVKGQAKSSDGLSADADMIEVRSELLGPISSIDTAAKKLVVLGQTVTLTATTIFEDGLPGITALRIGDIVELHGFSEPETNSLRATRVERKLLANVKAFKIQGAIRNLTPQTFSIGTPAAPAQLTVAYTGADLGGLTLTDALVVRIQLSTAASGGTRIATRIRANEIEAREVEDADVEGTITSFTSNSSFSVNGLPVNASGVAVPTGLGLGVHVDVEGSLVGGVLIATQVEIEDESDPLKFELNGTISALDSAAKTFVLRGVTVGFSGPVLFKEGIAADLSNVGGQSVKVKGLLSADGNRVNASEISLNR